MIRKISTPVIIKREDGIDLSKIMKSPNTRLDVEEEIIEEIKNSGLSALAQDLFTVNFRLLPDKSTGVDENGDKVYPDRKNPDVIEFFKQQSVGNKERYKISEDAGMQISMLSRLGIVHGIASIINWNAIAKLGGLKGSQYTDLFNKKLLDEISKELILTVDEEFTVKVKNAYKNRALLGCKFTSENGSEYTFYATTYGIEKTQSFVCQIEGTFKWNPLGDYDEESQIFDKLVYELFIRYYKNILLDSFENFGTIGDAALMVDNIKLEKEAMKAKETTEKKEKKRKSKVEKAMEKMQEESGVKPETEEEETPVAAEIQDLN